MFGQRKYDIAAPNTAYTGCTYQQDSTVKGAPSTFQSCRRCLWGRRRLTGIKGDIWQVALKCGVMVCPLEEQLRQCLDVHWFQYNVQYTFSLVHWWPVMSCLAFLRVLKAYSLMWDLLWVTLALVASESTLPSTGALQCWYRWNCCWQASKNWYSSPCRQMPLCCSSVHTTCSLNAVPVFILCAVCLYYGGGVGCDVIVDVTWSSYPFHFARIVFGHLKLL